MKSIARGGLALAGVFAVFLAGTYFGETHGFVARNAQIDMGVRISKDIVKHFGQIDPSDPNYKNIVGTIHLAKDMDLAVVTVDGLKTIRLFR